MMVMLVFLCLLEKATETLVCYVLDLKPYLAVTTFEAQDVVVCSYRVAKSDSTWSQQADIVNH